MLERIAAWFGFVPQYRLDDAKHLLDSYCGHIGYLSGRIYDLNEQIAKLKPQRDEKGRFIKQ